MKKAVALATVVLMIAIVAASCGGSGAGGGAAKITKDELIDGVTASPEKASTYRFEMHIVFNAKGVSGGESGEVNLNYDITGASDMVDQEMQMDMTMSGSFRTEGTNEQATGRMRTYLLGDTVYVGTQQDGSAEEWVRSDATESLRQSEDLLRNNVEIIRGADVKVLGTEMVGGVTCHVVEIYPDANKLLDLMRSQVGSSMPIPLAEGSISNFLCKGWYAEDTFLPMKGYQEYDLNSEQGADKLTSHVTADILLYDYNKPVSVDLPPEAKYGNPQNAWETPLVPGATPTPTPYKIGALFASSGFNSRLGETQKPTVEMLVDQINKAGGIDGHPLEVIIYDTQSDRDRCATLAEKLIEQGVVAIIGPTSTGESMAVKPIATQAGVTLVSCADGSEIVEPVRPDSTSVFNTPQLDYVAIERIYAYLKEHGITKIALLTNTAGYGAAGRKWLVNQTMLSKYGLTIVPDGDQTYGSIDADMRVQLTKIKSTDAQAVVCWGTIPGPATVANNMRTLGMTIPLLCSSMIDLKQFINYAGSAANGVILCAGKLPIVDQLPNADPQKALLEKYKADFEAWYGVGTSNTFGGNAYDALMMVVDALKAVGPDKAKIRDYIENNIVNWPGTGGVYNMSPQDHNGLPRDAKQAMILVQIENSTWTWLRD